MAWLQIPEPYVAGLIKIGELDDGTLQELSQALPSAPFSIQQDELTNFLSAKIAALPKESLGQIVRTLIGVAQAGIQLNLSTSEVVPLICSAMEQSTIPELKRTALECDGFGRRLVDLLKINMLADLAKAPIVISDHDHVFIKARILSDIRGIFASDAEADALPRAAAINHMLNIEHEHHGNKENFYVSMDLGDMEALIETLDRARSKAKGLTKLLEAAKVPLITSE